MRVCVCVYVGGGGGGKRYKGEVKEKGKDDCGWLLQDERVTEVEEKNETGTARVRTK